MSNSNEYSIARVDGDWAVRFNDEVISFCADHTSAERLARQLAQHLADLVRQPVRLALGNDAGSETLNPGAIAGSFGAGGTTAPALH